MKSQNDRMISVHFKGKPFNITVIQVYAWTSNGEEAEAKWFYEDLQKLLAHPHTCVVKPFATHVGEVITSVYV